MDLSPYLNMEEPTQQGRNQRKVLTLSPTLFSDDVPEPPFSFFLQSFRSGQVVRFVLLSTQFSVFVRDHVGRKVVVEERL